MSKDTIIKNMINDLMTESREDYITLRAILWSLESIYGIDDEQELKYITIKIVEILLTKGWLQAGLFYKFKWEMWDFSIDEIVKYIQQELNKLERIQNMDEIIWFEATEKGLQVFNSSQYQHEIDSIQIQY